MEPGLLAIAGADVVNVEPPGGDRGRRRPHELAYYNGGKKSVVLDLGSPDVIESLRRFAAGVDIVFIAPNRRSPVAGWEPDARRLGWTAPETIGCCLTAFGHGVPGDPADVARGFVCAQVRNARDRPRKPAPPRHPRQSAL